MRSYGVICRPDSIAFLIKSILFDYITFVGEAGLYVAAVLHSIVSVLGSPRTWARARRREASGDAACPDR